jgi:hypothetical protein
VHRRTLKMKICLVFVDGIKNEAIVDTKDALLEQIRPFLMGNQIVLYDGQTVNDIDTCLSLQVLENDMFDIMEL